MTVSYSTMASQAASGDDERDSFHDQVVPASLLVAGANLLAVEVHQVSATSSDLSFDLELVGLLTRVPPRLGIACSNGAAVLTWPSFYSDYQLFNSTSLSSSAGWSAVAHPVVSSNRFHTVVVPVGESSEYFRLSKP